MLISVWADDDSGDVLSPFSHRSCLSCPPPPAEPGDVVAVQPVGLAELPASRSPFACGPESFLLRQRCDPSHHAAAQSLGQMQTAGRCQRSGQ